MRLVRLICWLCSVQVQHLYAVPGASASASWKLPLARANRWMHLGQGMSFIVELCGALLQVGRGGFDWPWWWCRFVDVSICGCDPVDSVDILNPEIPSAHRLHTFLFSYFF
jgi:hypothetical protein